MTHLDRVLRTAVCCGRKFTGASVILIIVTLAIGCSRSNITGTVTDALTDQPILEVEVTVENSTSTARTDLAGKCSLAAAEGPVKLNLRKDGYIPASKDIGNVTRERYPQGWQGVFSLYPSLWTDTQSLTMWARPNPFWEKKFAWPEAKALCDQFEGFGYSNWRLPTVQEFGRMMTGLRSSLDALGPEYQLIGAYWTASDAAGPTAAAVPHHFDRPSGDPSLGKQVVNMMTNPPVATAGYTLAGVKCVRSATELR